MNEICFLLQNMYAQLLPLALPAPPMPGMGGPVGMGGGFAPPPPMGGLGMPPMPPYGMPPMGSSYWHLRHDGKHSVNSPMKIGVSKLQSFA